MRKQLYTTKKASRSARFMGGYNTTEVLPWRIWMSLGC